MPRSHSIPFEKLENTKSISKFYFLFFSFLLVKRDSRILRNHSQLSFVRYKFLFPTTKERNCKKARIPRASKPKRRKKNLHNLPSQYSNNTNLLNSMSVLTEEEPWRGALSSNEFVIRLNNSAASRRTFLDESFRNGSSVHSSNFHPRLSQSRLFRLSRIKSDIRSVRIYPCCIPRMS